MVRWPLNRPEKMMAYVNFQLRFPTTEIDLWAAKYPDEDDTEAFDAGAKIRRGDFGAANLERIIRWKSHRRLDLIYKNSPEEIADALRLSIDARQPRSAFSVLMGLRGVETPMASAILTAIDQNKYTVIDIRALEALGSKAMIDLNFYLDHYFPECLRLSAQAGVSLRQFDRALWSWSKHRSWSKHNGRNG